MLWRDNEREDRTAKTEDNRINELDNQSENVKKAYSNIQSLMERLDVIKQKNVEFKEETKALEKEAKEREKALEEKKARELAAIKKRAIIEARIKADRVNVEKEAERKKEAKFQAHQRELDEHFNNSLEETIKRKQDTVRKARLVRRKAEENRKKLEITQKREAEKRAKKLEKEREKQAKAEQLRILEEANRRHQEGERRAEKASMERQRRKERQKLIDEEKARRHQQREENQKETKRLKKELDEKKRAERMERANIRRQKKLARKSAELGGGIVNVHGTNITTEIRPVSEYSIKDLLGFVSRKEKRQATTEEELQKLIVESERKREEAREIAVRLQQLRKENYKNSPLGRRIELIKSFCEKQKKPLLIAFSIVLSLGLIGAGVLYHLTAYEYSYNGKTLGYVKNKEDVTEVTDLVQGALARDTSVAVVIDPRKDISFKRVGNLDGSLPIDTTDAVLKRLTYMGDFNVKACGIFIDGKKIGAVENNETAARVLQDIKDRYVSGKVGSEVEEAVIMENIDIRQSNTKLQNIYSEEGMVEKLCTSGEKETVHVVVPGETLSDIAKSFNITEEALTKENPGVNPKKLTVGSSLVIKQNAPVLTVRITEKRSYEENIEYKVEKKKDKTMYEGDTKVKQKGEKGLREVTDRIVLVNGETTSREVLEEKVEKEPTTKIVLVGSKERPPTIGSGTYIWPTNGSFRISSPFGPRWGRMHEGIDMACSTGTDVLASDGGTVTKAGYHGSYGMLVVVNHQNGVETYYAHNSKLLVKVGDKVYQGQHIAESGSTGRSTGPHIHFGVKVNGTFKNPRNYLPGRN